MKKLAQHGFTLIEMLVVAPIVILAIGAFITVIISLTGEVLSSRASNVLAYDVQSAIDRIDQDIKLSTGYLAQNDIPLQDGQGSDDNTANFVNVGGSNGPTLILSALATTGNPLSNDSGLVYLADQPNACSSDQVHQNTPMTINIIYFIKDDGSLWRRTVMPANYASGSAVSCSTPWQQPSCSPGYTESFCKTDDEKLVDGVSSSGFFIQYFTAASDTIANETASNSGASLDDRNAALQSSPTAGISIVAQQTVSGREVEQSASLRSTRLDVNASAIAYLIEESPSTPSVSASFTSPNIAVFNWGYSSGGNVTYDVDYNINGGGWTNVFNDTTAVTHTVTADHTDTVNLRVRANNSAGTTGYDTATVTIPLWAPLVLQNSWSNYGGAYSTAAYTMTKDGVVVIKGLVKRTGTAVGEEVITNLPDGYRPTQSLMFGGSTSSNVTSRIDVNANGNIERASGSEAWFSLETIRFVPDGRYTRTSTTPVNGWTNYGGEWAPGSYVQVDDSRVFVQGMMRSGTWTNGTQIFDIPDALLPSGYMHVAGRSNGWGYFGIEYRTTAAQGILAKATGNTYLSVNGSYYPASYASWSSLSLVNGWTWYGSIFSTPEYTKSPTDNMVSLKGLVKSGSTSAGSTITTLPSGFRPKERILYTTVANDGYCRIDIQSSGVVTNQSGCPNGWLSLDGVTFMAEQ